ncbi:hypothetical protein [Nocardia otitidiscaviarum]|uniref:hypothetical protein n=1 Tax=Nocardia otitidiscaviarum TaxID=1823 RepID=UPI002453E71C|nr:hypothetical protein [Nocardia otitidiscaviarum]
MSTQYYINTATTVFAYLRSRILWFPIPGDTTILAWASDFEESRLTHEDLLAGVKRAYETTEGEFRPTPISIIRAAREARTKNLAELPKPQRDLMNEANYTLQDMDFTPNQAARIAQAWALDQGSPIPMSPEQYNTFLTRMEAKKQDLANRQPRELESIWNVLRAWDPTTDEGRQPRRAFTRKSTENTDHERGAAA